MEELEELQEKVDFEEMSYSDYGRMHVAPICGGFIKSNDYVKRLFIRAKKDFWLLIENLGIDYDNAKRIKARFITYLCKSLTCPASYDVMISSSFIVSALEHGFPVTVDEVLDIMKRVKLDKMSVYNYTNRCLNYNITLAHAKLLPAIVGRIVDGLGLGEEVMLKTMSYVPKINGIGKKDPITAAASLVYVVARSSGINVRSSDIVSDIRQVLRASVSKKRMGKIIGEISRALGIDITDGSSGRSTMQSKRNGDPRRRNERMCFSHNT